MRNGQCFFSQDKNADRMARPISGALFPRIDYGEIGHLRKISFLRLRTLFYACIGCLSLVKRREMNSRHIFTQKVVCAVFWTSFYGVKMQDGA